MLRQKDFHRTNRDVRARIKELTFDNEQIKKMLKNQSTFKEFMELVEVMAQNETEKRELKLMLIIYNKYFCQKNDFNNRW